MTEKREEFLLREKEEYVNNYLDEEIIEPLYYNGFVKGHDIGNLEGIVYSGLPEAKEFSTKEDAQAVIDAHSMSNIFEVVTGSR